MLANGDETIGFFKEFSRERAKCRTESPSPEGARSASRIASVIAEIVMEPRAMDVATVTKDCGPYTGASSAKPTAAEFGKLTVSARSALSELRNFWLERAQKNETAYRTAYTISSTRVAPACS